MESVRGRLKQYAKELADEHCSVYELLDFLGCHVGELTKVDLPTLKKIHEKSLTDCDPELVEEFSFYVDTVAKSRVKEPYWVVKLKEELAAAQQSQEGLSASVREVFAKGSEKLRMPMSMQMLRGPIEGSLEEQFSVIAQVFAHIPEEEYEQTLQTLHDVGALSPEMVKKPTKELMILASAQAPEVRLALGKFLAGLDGAVVFQLLVVFLIQDQSARAQVIEAGMRQDARAVARTFSKFDVKEPVVRVRLAKLSAELDAWGTARYFNQFAIEDEKERFEIALRCAELDGDGTSLCISCFELSKLEYLTEVAKRCAVSDGGALALNFSRFGLGGLSEHERIEIARLAAKHDGRGTACYFQNFGISDLTARQAVCLDAAAQSSLALKHLREFFPEREGVEGLVEFFECYYSEPTKSFDRAKMVIANLSKKHPDFAQFIEFDLAGSDILLIGQVLKGFDYLWHFTEKYLGPEFRFQSKIPSLDTAEDLRACFDEMSLAAAAYLYLSIELAKTDLVAEKILPDLWQLQKLALPDLAIVLARLLVEEVRSDASEFQDTSQTLPWYRALHLAYGHLLRTGVSRDLIFAPETGLVSILEGRIHSLFSSRRHGRIAVEFFSRLIHVERFTADDRAQVLQTIISAAVDPRNASKRESETAALQQMQLVNSLLLFGAEDKLKQAQVSYADLLQEVFTRDLPIAHVENFAEKFTTTFGASRDPTAIAAYAARLRRDRDADGVQCVARLISDILNGKYYETRYGVEKNDNLKKIQQARPNFLEKWRRNAAFRFDKLVQGSLEEELVVTPFDWLRMKILEDRHLPLDEMPYLERFFRARSDEERTEIRSELNQTIQEHTSDRSSKGRERYMRLRLQKQCMVIASRDSMKSDELKELRRLLQEPQFANLEFAHDVRDYLDSSPLATERSERYYCVETDDPMDLLLCGQEVPGSCMRLDGATFYSRRLLGYLLDGKNRLLAVKTELGPEGKIVARCILRVLWDGKGPVLFRERIYPTHGLPVAYVHAINELARRKAKKLNLPLLALDGEGKPYKNDISSLGSWVPYDHTDAFEFGWTLPIGSSFVVENPVYLDPS